MTVADIEISVTQSDAASRTLSVTVPPERVAAAEAETVRWYSTKAKLPGFRKGHIPAPVVRKRFGDAIRQSVLEDLVRESWNRAREEQKLQPLGDPQIRILKFEQGQPLSFEMRVDVKPEIRLGRLGGFRLTRQVARVTDEMIDAQLLQLREQRAPWLPAEGRAKPGDLVEIELDGEAKRVVLGQGNAPPELEEQIMQLEPGGSWEGAVKAGETPRQVKVTLRIVVASASA